MCCVFPCRHIFVLCQASAFHKSLVLRNAFALSPKSSSKSGAGAATVAAGVRSVVDRGGCRTLILYHLSASVLRVNLSSSSGRDGVAVAAGVYSIVDRGGCRTATVYHLSTSVLRVNLSSSSGRELVAVAAGVYSSVDKGRWTRAGRQGPVENICCIS